MADGNGATLQKWVLGVIGTLFVAGIVGGVTMGNSVAANTVKIERNERAVVDLKQDILRRLDQIEATQREILKELRAK